MMGKNDSRIEYLEVERKKIWQRLTEIEKRTPEDVKEVKSASKMASQYRNKCQSTLDEAERYLSKIKNGLDNAQAALEGAEEAKQNCLEIGKKCSTVLDLINKYQKRYSELDQIYERLTYYEEIIESLETNAEQSKESKIKIDAALKSIMSRKSEIDEVHTEILGYEEENEDGAPVKVSGLKGQLEGTYEELESNLGSFDKRLSTLEQTSQDRFEEWVSNNNKAAENTKAQIKKLLPEALTTGLSHAYSAKKSDELKDYSNYAKSFRKAILVLTLISTIPFVLSIIFLVQGTGLSEVIERAPKLVLAILPLYIPTLWLAYSASKKMNLSKRLIEEYSHKEVVSKTYEGLVTQINDLKEEQISEELRTKLLFNMLEVSSENPGKLISDYNKSDHPVIDTLDKSIKLSNAVDRLAKIPGFGKLADILNRKEQDLLQSENYKAESSLNKADKIKKPEASQED